MSVRIIIVDDHNVLRTGLRALLSTETVLEVVGEAADGEEAIILSKQLHPDVIIMDITMPGINGLETAKKILSDAPGVKVLFLTMHEDVNLLQEALDIGAVGYVLKRAVESELINAIHAVTRGDLYVDPALTRALFQRTASPPPSNLVAESISPRETEVLKLIAQGYTNRQIGDTLCISIRTVESHRANIMQKLNIKSRVELVRYALDHGIFD